MIHELIGSGAHTIAWWQTCVRAVIIFICGLAMIRVLGRRAFGEQSPLDILLAIIMGSNLSRAMTANAAFVPTLAGTLAMLVLYWMLARCAARWPWFGWLVKGRPIALVSSGRFDRKTMRKTAVSDADMKEAARAASLADVGKIGNAVLERSGKISIVPRQ